MSNRRSFIRKSAAWLGASWLAPKAFSANPENQRTISIFHTTDLHGHILPTRSYDGEENLGGLARCATRIREWRKRFPHSILVDLGDVYQGTAVSHQNQGELMMQLFNSLDYSAWTIGNHDFDWGRPVLEQNLALSQAPVLGGNLLVDSRQAGTLSGVWKNLRSWTMVEVGGMKIALVGLVTPGLPFWLPTEVRGGVEVEMPENALRRAVAEARSSGADAVVVMGHMGFRTRDDFANPLRETLNAVAGVDAYLGGHTHRNAPMWNIGKVLCSQAGYHGIHLGRLDLSFDTQSRKLLGCHAVCERMGPDIALDPAVVQMAEPELKSSSEQLARKVAEVSAVVKSGGPDNPLATLFCECFSEALKRESEALDGIYHGTFGTGDLLPGTLRVADCWKLIPYENRLVIADLSAADLIDILKEERKLRGSDRILWPFQLRLSQDGEIVRFTRDGSEVDTNARFKIACNGYDAQSGGRSMMKLREIMMRPESRLRTTSVDTRSALIEGLARRQVIG
ncbi:MAG: bifunctional metallophosphatase/5'-nucleotidase [Luteolibacter sp.]